MKKMSLILVVSMLAAMLVGCGGSGSSNAPASSGGSSAPAPSKPEKQEVLVIRVASEQAEGNPRTVALYEFEKEVEEKSGGTIDVQNFPNSQLGTEEEYMEATIAGEIEICTVGSSIASRYPNYAALSVPFMLKSFDAAKEILASDYCRNEMFGDFGEKTGLHFLAYSTYGFRDIGSTVPVEKIDDFKPLRFRNNGSQQQVAIVENWGANPVSFPMGELYTALEQKAADIFELPLTSILSSKFYEIAPYIVKSNHTLDMGVLGMNDDFYQSLSAEHKAIIDEAAVNYQNNLFDLTEELSKDAYSQMEAAGATIMEPSDEFMNELITAQDDIGLVLDQIFPGCNIAIEKIKEIAAEIE